MEDPEVWLKLADRYGVTLVMLVVIVLAIRRFILWIRPFIEAFFTAHFGLIKTIEDSDKVNTDIRQRLADTMEQNTAILASYGPRIVGFEDTNRIKISKIDALHEDVRELHPKVDSLHQKIDGLRKDN